LVLSKDLETEQAILLYGLSQFCFGEPALSQSAKNTKEAIVWHHRNLRRLCYARVFEGARVHGDRHYVGRDVLDEGL
jgi:hypothetical protein